MKHLRPLQENNASLGELFNKYPETPGYKKEGTSKDAAIETQHEASYLREQCLILIREQPSTADEVATRLGRSILAIRPRLSELVAKSKIIESGQRRRNISGKMAAVWIIKE